MPPLPTPLVATRVPIQLEMPQSQSLSPDYYKFTCPQADEIVVSILKKAIAKEPRIAASLLRLLFHDCFVQVSTVHIHFLFHP